jgi:hypothetical protein
MKNYNQRLTVNINRKGVLDIDTVKGCACGMGAHPSGGCYGLCYANRLANAYGYDFTTSTSRTMRIGDAIKVTSKFTQHPLNWFRIGTMGDPCHDWVLTLKVCEAFSWLKTPVVVTKHWRIIPDAMLKHMAGMGVVVNTSISALDTDVEINHRLRQFNRLRAAGVRSVLRVVSCKFGVTDECKRLTERQDELLATHPVIDNPLRIPRTDPRVASGTILVEKRDDLGGGSMVSLYNEDVYIGKCDQCPDQCGVNLT